MVGNLKAGEKKEFVNEAKFTQDGKQTTDKGKGLYSKESTGPKVDKENLTEDGSVKDAFIAVIIVKDKNILSCCN
ncbi:MAG: hypothetical protein ACLU6Y_06575 [Ruminococcus sp.]